MLDLIFIKDFSDTTKDLIKQAFDLGVENLILVKDFSSKDLISFNDFKKLFEKKINLFSCQLISEKNKQNLKSMQDKVSFFGVDGKNLNLNKFAVSKKGIDFLFQAFDEKKIYFDTGLARIASENNLKHVFLFEGFLCFKGTKRGNLFKNAFFVSKLLKKYKVDCLFFSGASKKESLRIPKDYSCLLEIFNFDKLQAKRFANRISNELIS